ncbi:unnamed protein product [Brassica oleracea var. botrytis]
MSKPKKCFCEAKRPLLYIFLFQRLEYNVIDPSIPYSV